MHFSTTMLLSGGTKNSARWRAKICAPPKTCFRKLLGMFIGVLNVKITAWKSTVKRLYRYKIKVRSCLKSLSQIKLDLKELSFCHKSQQPNDACPSYFKLTLFDPPEFIVWNIYGLPHLVLKKLGFQNPSLWQRLNYFVCQNSKNY